MTSDRPGPTIPPEPDALRAEGLGYGYPNHPVGTDLTVDIPAGSFTAVVGPNACGKSTLLRVLSRLLKPTAGQVVLDGRAITSYPSREVARRLGLLPQSSIAPEGITVTDLVGRGRFPYQRRCGSGRARTSGRCGRRCTTPASPTWPTGWSTSCRAGSGSGCGWPWCWPSRHR
jgi:ABC transporter family protein